MEMVQKYVPHCNILFLTFAARTCTFFNSGPAHQGPLSHSAGPQQFSSLASPPSQLIARCPFETHWECFYRKTVYCLCAVDHGAHNSTGNPGSTGNIAAQALPQAKEITTFDVLAEIQPGNNDTLVTLFAIQCEPLTRYGCYWLPENGMFSL